MQDRQTKIKSIVIIIMVWLVALAFLALFVFKMRALLSI
jgi:hypothetical protein